MTVINKLASALNRRDEGPNEELAKQIAVGNDKKAVKELVDNLYNKDKGIQSDCIKTLYETGALKPQLLALHADALLSMLENKNNRLQWGAMMALKIITNEIPEKIYASLGKIIAAADKGTVITNDGCVSILIKLCAIKQYADDAFALLNERILRSPANQLPSYAENALPVIRNEDKAVFLATLTSRLGDLEQETKRSRLKKVIKKAKG